MFLISCIFRKRRSVRKPDMAGGFYVTLSERCALEDGSFVWQRNDVNTGIASADGEITDEIRLELNKYVRLIYCIIEHLDASGQPFTRVDVIECLKLALRNGPSMQEIIRCAETDFPLRADLVSLGNEFKRDFRFIYSSPTSQPKADCDTLTGFLLYKSIEFKNEGKNATARSYANTACSLEKFNNGNLVRLSHIDKEYIVRYSSWLKENGVADSTQSFYLRTLRSALNYASEEQGVVFEPNLFDGLNTKIYRAAKPASATGINRELIQKITNANFHDDKETELVRDMFMFSFYCHGMELSDVINLKKENLRNGQLVFSRRQKGMKKEILLDKAATNILDKYNASTTLYLFPIMEAHQGLLYYSISERVRKSMKRIGEKVGHPTLSFNTNIQAWQQVVSQLDLSSIVLGKLG